MIKDLIMSNICAAAIFGGAYVYGMNSAEQAESTFIPLNSAVFRARLPDGRDLAFVRDSDNQDILNGPHPFCAIERPRQHMVNVTTVPGFRTAKPEEYCFIDGWLRFATIGKKDYEFKPFTYAVPTNSIESLWQASTMSAEKRPSVDIWRGGGRLRLFSRNPNRTALIFAEALMLAFSGMLFISGWYFRIVGFTCSIALFIPILMTQSRGGLLGAFAGVALLAFFRFRHRFNPRHLIRLAIGALAILAACHFAGFGQRFKEARDGDQSTMSRLVMWREVPRMIAAAPLGWGLWKSGQAYNSWFEEPKKMHMTGDLFNDHLSRFVEGGFIFGGLYVFAWALLFLWCGRLAWRGGSPVPLAVWMTYFVASCFNPMNFWTRSFYIPIAITVWTLVHQIRQRRSSGHGESDAYSLPCIAFVLTVTVLAAAVVVAVNAPKQDVPLKVSALGRRIIVGHGDPRIWIVDDGFVLCGDYNGFPGRELRKFYRNQPNAEAVGLVERLDDLPGEIELLVVTGQQCKRFLSAPDAVDARRAVLYSPPFAFSSIPDALAERYDITLLTGQFAARFTEDFPISNPRVIVARGAELYIPGWLDFILKKVDDT